MNPKYSEASLRKAAVAGTFYPQEKNELQSTIEKYISAASIESFSGIPQIILVPHAGYPYSGPVAAYAYKVLPKGKYSRVILLGVSHNYTFTGVKADGNEFWETPLGLVAVDQEYISVLQKEDVDIKTDSKYHELDHSLEVQVPFLIETLGAEIKIVPLFLGTDEINTEKMLAQTIQKYLDQKTLIVISSDLAHYPNYSDAQKIDNETLTMIVSEDTSKLQKSIDKIESQNFSNVSTVACGAAAIKVGMLLAGNLKLQSHLLKYANSGDIVGGDKSQVVGYGVVGFYQNNMDKLPEDYNQSALSVEEQTTALKIARESIGAKLQGNKYSLDDNLPPIFYQKFGVFVTLKEKNELRGCVGLLESTKSLVQTVSDMAVAAAFNDPRFTPLTSTELSNAKIGISVLSPMEMIDDASIIEIGKHGVYIENGQKSGVLLPQVATEQGWNRETFLNKLCEEKVDLNQNCWQDKNSKIYIFTAQTFEE